jgi:hypothetical protein
VKSVFLMLNEHIDSLFPLSSRSSGKPVPTPKSSAAAKKQESSEKYDSEEEVAKKPFPKKG